MNFTAIPSEAPESLPVSPSLLETNNAITWTATTVLISIALFIVAGTTVLLKQYLYVVFVVAVVVCNSDMNVFICEGFFEVGGGYLVWIGIREKKLPYIFIPLGCIILGIQQKEF